MRLQSRLIRYFYDQIQMLAFKRLLVLRTFELSRRVLIPFVAKLTLGREKLVCLRMTRITGF